MGDTKWGYDGYVCVDSEDRTITVMNLLSASEATRHHPRKESSGECPDGSTYRKTGRGEFGLLVGEELNES